MTQEEFIENEIWTLTIAGAFQRSNVYKDTELKESEKNAFKEELHGFVIEIAKNYKEKVLEPAHLSNIESISSFAHSSLKSPAMNFGISQKILNLYLKYMWCLGRIPEPPHFPVDRIIQEIIQKGIGLKGHEIVAWTAELNRKKYEDIIEKAKILANSKKQKISEWELENFSRRQNKST